MGLRGAEQSARLRQALSLWRGPVLAEFTYQPFAQREITALEELRLVAIEERVETDLALGRHGQLVAELEALVAEHPFREGLRGELMVALYRAGRQAEALAVYRDARQALAEELGIEPGPGLRQLEGAILRDPSLDLEPAGRRPWQSEPRTPLRPHRGGPGSRGDARTVTACSLLAVSHGAGDGPTRKPIGGSRALRRLPPVFRGQRCDRRGTGRDVLVACSSPSPMKMTPAGGAAAVDLRGALGAERGGRAGSRDPTPDPSRRRDGRGCGPHPWLAACDHIRRRRQCGRPTAARGQPRRDPGRGGDPERPSRRRHVGGRRAGRPGGTGRFACGVEARRPGSRHFPSHPSLRRSDGRPDG